MLQGKSAPIGILCNQAKHWKPLDGENKLLHNFCKYLIPVQKIMIQISVKTK